MPASTTSKPVPKGFEYVQTNCHAQCSYKDGAWGPVRMVESPYLQLHIAATSLHYGQAIFEGLKANMCKDGKVRVFRADENGLRLNRSAERMAMPAVPAAIFEEAVTMVVSKNIEYVPDYGTGGSLYIRPLLIGSGPSINLYPSDAYEFIVFVSPAGNFYEGGIKPVEAYIPADHDRAAPKGMGSCKVAGNYGACYTTSIAAKQKGFPVTLYLDAATRTFIEEFSSSNFFAISADGKKYITPESDSILASITNKSLITLAEDMGLTVERRPVSIDELNEFAEVGACGTAVVITPVSRIVRACEDGDKEYTFTGTAKGLGPVMQRLYDRIRAIQLGEEEDKFGWTLTVE